MPSPVPGLRLASGTKSALLSFQLAVFECIHELLSFLGANRLLLGGLLLRLLVLLALLLFLLILSILLRILLLLLLLVLLILL